MTEVREVEGAVIQDLFILGSGFSKAISRGIMPTLSELSAAVGPQIDDIFLPQEKPPKQLLENIEALLSFLATDQPWLPKPHALRNRAAFLELSTLIANQLKKNQSEALGGTLNDSWAGLVKKWHEQKVNVITFNYDLLVEIEATKVGGVNQNDLYPVVLTPALQREAGVLGGTPCPTLQLFKLHGSLNWYYSGAADFHGETIYTNPVKTGAFEEKEDHRLAVKDKVPLIIPPTLDKASFFNNETIRHIWWAAGEALKKANRIFCLGYSFPITDMMVRFFALMNQTPHKAVFYWINQKEWEDREQRREEFRKVFPEGCELDQKYVSEDAVERFAKDYVEGKVA